jgi:hypothetical protein
VPVRSTKKRSTFPCAGHVSVNVHVGNRIATVSFSHSLLHFTHPDLRLSAEARALVDRLRAAGMKKPSDVVKAVLAAGKAEKREGATTKQVS